MARSRVADRPVRAASRHVHPDRRAIGPTLALQRAGHADLVDTPHGDTFIVYLCGRPIPQSRPLHAGPRDGDAADGVGIGRLAADAWMARGCRWWRPPRRRCRRTHSRPRQLREDFDSPVLPIDFQWLRSPWPDELFSLTARPGHLRLVRTRDDGQPLPSVAGRAATAVALLQRRRRWSTSSPSTSSRWPVWSATTTAPSSTTCTSRTTRPSAGTCA